MRDCIPSPSGPGPSADGIWHGLLPVQALMQPDVPVPPGARTSIVVQQGQIQWVGPDAAVPPAWLHLARRQGAGALVTPGLVDCHTHLVYAGQRANEFAMRLAGASYEEVARSGGGIVAGGEDDLVRLLARVHKGQQRRHGRLGLPAELDLAAHAVIEDAQRCLSLTRPFKAIWLDGGAARPGQLLLVAAQ